MIFINPNVAWTLKLGCIFPLYLVEKVIVKCVNASFRVCIFVSKDSEAVDSVQL